MSAPSGLCGCALHADGDPELNCRDRCTGTNRRLGTVPHYRQLSSQLLAGCSCNFAKRPLRWKLTFADQVLPT